MNVIRYRTELDTDKKNVLVKESVMAYGENKIDNTRKIVDMVNELYHMNLFAEEYIYVVAFDTKMNLLGIFEVSHGIVNASLCGNREIIIRCLLVGASCFMLLHNHPSGDCTPSQSDMDITENVKNASALVGISLLDHIIIGGGNSYFSFKEKDMM